MPKTLQYWARGHTKAKWKSQAKKKKCVKKSSSYKQRNNRWSDKFKVIWLFSYENAEPTV